MFSTVYRILFCPFNKSWLLTWVLSPVSRQKALTWWSYMTRMSTWHDKSVALLHRYVNMTWHTTGPITLTCQHMTWHVCGPVTLTHHITSHHMPVALLHQPVIMTQLTPNFITAAQTEQCQAFSILSSSCLVSTDKYLDSCPDVCIKKQCCLSSTFSESLITRNMVWYTLKTKPHFNQSIIFNWKKI